MKLRATLFALTAMLAGGASAHIRWFVDPATVPDVPFVFNSSMVITFVTGLIYIALTLFLTRRFAEGKSGLAKLMKTDFELPAKIEWYLLFFLLALMLVINMIMGDYLAPNLPADGWVGIIGLVIQVVVVLLIFVTPVVVGAAMVLVAFLNLALFGFTLGMDYFFEVAFVGAAFIFIGPYVSKVDQALFRRFMPEEGQWKTLAVLALRIGLGLQLMELAINNKFVNTGFTLVFMEDNPYYNFMQLLGFSSFSNADFAWAAGIFEFMFGSMLVLGLATRLVILTLTFVFIMTAILTGIHELVGHLPIFGVAIIILLQSNAKLNEPTKMAPQAA